MNNNFNEDKENLAKESEKLKNKKIKKYSFLIIVAFIISFFGSYLITDRLTNPKYKSINSTADVSEKTVYNNTKSLKDDMVITLMNDGVIEKEQSVSEFKKENSIESDISEQFIVNFFLANGYKLEELQDSKVVFSKENTSMVLKPNKYYLGEKDGYFAIYKTDSEGNLTIESEDDVYKNSRPISFLTNKEDLDEIKEFKNCFDTKDEAKEKLSAYIS